MKDNARLYGAYKLDDGWHGYQERNHKSPSGCDRFYMIYSDNEAYPTEELAILKIKEKLGIKTVPIEWLKYMIRHFYKLWRKTIERERTEKCK